MTQEPEFDKTTFAEFKHTLTDTRNGFTVAVYVKLDEDGILIGHEFGTFDGTSYASTHGVITVDSLKELYKSCHQDEIGVIGMKVMMQSYDPQTREMKGSIETLEISFQEPLNFRPFFLKFLPIIIKAAELIDEDMLPPTVNVASLGIS